MRFIGIEMITSLRNVNMSLLFLSPIVQRIRKFTLIYRQRTFFGKNSLGMLAFSSNWGGICHFQLLAGYMQLFSIYDLITCLPVSLLTLSGIAQSLTKTPEIIFIGLLNFPDGFILNFCYVSPLLRPPTVLTYFLYILCF